VEAVNWSSVPVAVEPDSWFPTAHRSGIDAGRWSSSRLWNRAKSAGRPILVHPVAGQQDEVGALRRDLVESSSGLPVGVGAGPAVGVHMGVGEHRETKAVGLRHPSVLHDRRIGLVREIRNVQRHADPGVEQREVELAGGALGGVGLHEVDAFERDRGGETGGDRALDPAPARPVHLLGEGERHVRRPLRLHLGSQPVPLAVALDPHGQPLRAGWQDQGRAGDGVCRGGADRLASHVIGQPQSALAGGGSRPVAGVDRGDGRSRACRDGSPLARVGQGRNRLVGQTDRDRDAQ